MGLNYSMIYFVKPLLMNYKSLMNPYSNELFFLVH